MNSAKNIQIIRDRWFELLTNYKRVIDELSKESNKTIIDESSWVSSEMPLTNRTNERLESSQNSCNISTENINIVKKWKFKRSLGNLSVCKYETTGKENSIKVDTSQKSLDLTKLSKRNNFCVKRRRCSNNIPISAISLADNSIFKQDKIPIPDEHVHEPQNIRPQTPVYSEISIEKVEMVDYKTFIKDKKISRTFIELTKCDEIEVVSTKDNTEASPVIQVPYLPPKCKGDKEYTLVLDLDETLIHYPDFTAYEDFDQDFYMLRPGLHKFLKRMAEYYEIVVFTAGTQDYADYILDQVDFCHKISHRLYRQHWTLDGNIYRKDLDKLGRDLAKVIIVDNLPENFEKHQNNGITIKSWYDDMDDTVLGDLGDILEEIQNKQPKDLRVALERYRTVLRKYT